MFNWREYLPNYSTLPEHSKEIFNFLEQRYKDKPDPWGLDYKTIESSLKIVWPLYKHYFKVRTFGSEKIQNKPYMFVSNHTGQIAFDGALLYCALLTDVHPPRVLRAMVERFIPLLPFLGQLFAQGGAVLGDRKNCQQLLQNGESIMVFPEGVKGIAKNTADYYKIQEFTRGFYRMALANNIQIIPTAIIGCEEMYPYVWHPRGLAKKLNLPALPLSASFALGPLGALPLPSPVDIYFGDPIDLPEELETDSSDKEIDKEVIKLETKIQDMIRLGLKKRRPFKEKIGLPDQRDV